MKPIKLSINEFEAKYKPQKNHLDDNASFSEWGYETYGKELEYVMSIANKEPNRVWTVTDCDGALVIGDGYHLVNRMLYIITEIPFADDESITVIDREDEEQYTLGLTVKDKDGKIVYTDDSGGIDGVHSQFIEDGLIDEDETGRYEMEEWLKENGYTYEFKN